MNVIHALEGDEKRFNELKRATCARSKTLSEVLDELIENDVVVRRVEPQAPVAVYYSLTTKGEELLDAVAGLAEWTERWDGTDTKESDHRVE
jgi:DNA-binding HxlR family transcriptional regulator